MSQSLHHVKIPSDLGTRLRELDRLSQIPETLGEYCDLLQEYLKKCLKEPRFKAHFHEIYTGKKIFGCVKYETHHKITLLNGRKVYVACALDALVEGFFLPIEINSSCFHCSQPIRIWMTRGTIDSVKPSSTVMWLGASKEGIGSCEKYLCPYINFFISAKHVEEWKDENADELGMMLTLQQSLKLVRKSYWETISHVCAHM